MPYDANFIPGITVNLPVLSNEVKAVAFKGGAPVGHTRFSVIFRQDRGFALCTAHNIDGVSLIPEGKIKRKDRFRFDPDIPSDLQVDNDRGYKHNPWDRGHLVRRRALHWQSEAEARQADSESYFWSNIAPQHEHLHDSPWGSIEDWMLERADVADQQACIFTGPIFTTRDEVETNLPGEIPFRVPAGFWKIMAIKVGGNLRAAAFLVWQRDFDRVEPLEFDPITEQVRITTIEYLTGLSFPNLHDADPLRFGAHIVRRAGRRTLAARSGLPRVAALTDPGEIVL